MSFTPHQRQLLLHSCYGDPKLPEYLERIVVEGPGEYDWPPAPGSYEGEQIPLHERIWAQIWHQGDIYPATYVAVPVLCEVVARFPELNHATLLSQLVMIERSRPRFEPRLKPHLDAETLTAYDAALAGLLPHLPAQLRIQDDSKTQGFSAAEAILALMAFVTGQQWLGMMLGRGNLPLTHEQAAASQTAFNREYADEVLLPGVLQAAFFLGRDDLPQSLRAEHAAYRAHLERMGEEPPQDLEL